MALKQGFHLGADVADGGGAEIIELRGAVRYYFTPILIVSGSLELQNHALIVIGVVHDLLVGLVVGVIGLLLHSLVQGISCILDVS